jgi:hypothetical protein
MGGQANAHDAWATRLTATNCCHAHTVSVARATGARLTMGPCSPLRRDMLSTSATNNFPPYDCERNPATSPFSLASTSRTYRSAAQITGVAGRVNKVCFTLQTKPTTRKSPCNSMDFEKLEFQIGG